MDSHLFPPLCLTCLQAIPFCECVRTPVSPSHAAAWLSPLTARAEGPGRPDEPPAREVSPEEGLAARRGDTLCRKREEKDSPLDLLAALREIRHALQFASDSPNGPIQDTIWMMHRSETLFAYIDRILAAPRPADGAQEKEALPSGRRAGKAVSEELEEGESLMDALITGIIIGMFIGALLFSD